MNIFEEILSENGPVELTKTGQQPPEITKTVSKHVSKPLDPRPDLQSDSQVWTQLLATAQDMDPALEFYSLLLGFRAMGTRLVMLTEPPYRGEYRMRGQFDGTGAEHWATQTDYQETAVRYLGPPTSPNQYGQMLKEALGKLSFKKG